MTTSKTYTLTPWPATFSYLWRDWLYRQYEYVLHRQSIEIYPMLLLWCKPSLYYCISNVFHLNSGGLTHGVVYVLLCMSNIAIILMGWMVIKYIYLPYLEWCNSPCTWLTLVVVLRYDLLNVRRHIWLCERWMKWRNRLLYIMVQVVEFSRGTKQCIACVVECTREKKTHFYTRNNLRFEICHRDKI